jgi:hypothetical protein
MNGICRPPRANSTNKLTFVEKYLSSFAGYFLWVSVLNYLFFSNIHIDKAY